MHKESQFTNFHTTVMHETIHTDDAPTTLSTRNALINTTMHKEWMVGGLCREIELFVAFVVCQWDIQEHLNRLKLLCICISQEIVCYRTHTQTSCFLPEFLLTFLSFIFPPLHLISRGSWKLMLFIMASQPDMPTYLQKFWLEHATSWIL